jgi:hypothetical protein
MLRRVTCDACTLGASADSRAVRGVVANVYREEIACGETRNTKETARYNPVALASRRLQDEAIKRRPATAPLRGSKEARFT